MAEQMDQAVDEARRVRHSIGDVVDAGEKALDEALRAALHTIGTATQAAERVLQDGLEAFRGQTAAYVDTAVEQLDGGGRFLRRQVKERPMTAPLVGFGVGLLLGLILAHRAR